MRFIDASTLTRVNECVVERVNFDEYTINASTLAELSHCSWTVTFRIKFNFYELRPLKTLFNNVNDDFMTRLRCRGTLVMKLGHAAEGRVQKFKNLSL